MDMHDRLDANEPDTVETMCAGLALLTDAVAQLDKGALPALQEALDDDPDIVWTLAGLAYALGPVLDEAVTQLEAGDLLRDEGAAVVQTMESLADVGARLQARLQVYETRMNAEVERNDSAQNIH